MRILRLFIFCLVTACASNSPIRDSHVTNCETMLPCSNSYYEVHPNYDIGFVEYSERGNDFNPERTQDLLGRLKQYSAKGGLAVIVFIHGWKHNADRNDENVKSFSKALANLSASGVMNGRRLVGVYVGWRGLSLHGLGLENTTYWDRKATAEEVGRGGVTDLLARLEQIDRTDDDNYLVIVGHSFGGAITLSALHDQLLERLHNQQLGLPVKAFGDAVIMLNPAIEASQGLLLKENSLKVGATGADAQSLLYVISSKGDTATHFLFPLGQWLGVNLTWNQIDLSRKYNNEIYTLTEETMDTTTIGNYSLFHTSKIRDPDIPRTLPDQKSFSAGADSLHKAHRILAIKDTRFGEWELKSHCTKDGDNGGPQIPRMPCYDNEPINFIYTTDSFIGDHNDIFNPALIAFMSTAVSKAVYENSNGTKFFAECRDADTGQFNFSSCFTYHHTKALGTKNMLEE